MLNMFMVKKDEALRQSRNRRRSQRLLLRVPVIAYRSQKLGLPFSEGTHTLVVNAHGALINLRSKVAVQEKVFLKHAISGKELECRVVFSRGNSMIGPAEVGLEFRQPTPNFWNIAFPPNDWLQNESA
jgi:hypothetical protein